MIQKITIIFFFFFSISSLYPMHPEFFYGSEEIIPSLYTHKSGIPSATYITEEMIRPSIDTISASEQFYSSFSIELLKYKSTNNLPDFDQKYDYGIQSAIFNNPYTTVIAQNEGPGEKKLHKIFIPIQQNNNNDAPIISKTNLFALALIAGSKHFQTRTVQIRIHNEDMNIWEQLFNGQHKIQNSNQEIPRQSFSLNFVQSDIKNILMLVNIIRPNFDLESIIATVSTYKPEKQTEQLNNFLIIGKFEENTTETLQENFSAEDEQDPLNSLAWYYAKIKRAQSNIYKKFFMPIKNWYNYFYESYQLWKELLFG